ncbi:hypothetical protein KR054_009447 [Drosophila jambulina]|nr:hypothetical protein KR054_009447 [Drosophila jambulina]
MLFTYKELIDLAIGSPESGHVNFYALQVLLTCFAQHLEVMDKVVEVQNCVLFEKDDTEFRLFAGADAEDAAPTEQANEAPEEPANEAPVEVAPVEEAPVEEAPVEEAPVGEAPVEEAPVGEAPVEEAPDGEAQVEEAPGGELQLKKSPPPFTIKVEPEADDKEAAEPGGEPQTEPAPASGLGEIQDETNQNTQINTPGRYSLLSSRSSHRKLASTVDPSVLSYIVRLEKRLGIMEINNEKATMDMEQFVSHFKVHLMLTIEQMNHVAHLLLDRKRDPRRIKIVRFFAKELKALMGTGDKEGSVSWSTEELDVGEGEEEDVIEDDFFEEEFSIGTTESTSLRAASSSLKGNVPLGFERMYNDVVQLKSQVCGLTNKVNELAAFLAQHECSILLGKFEELKKAIHELHLFKERTQEITTNIMETLNGTAKQIDSLQKSAILLDDRKSDRLEVELMMAEKVSFKQLATKASLEQFEDYKFTQEGLFCEVRHLISEHERNVLQIIDNLRMTLGIDAMEVGLKDFRQMVEKRVAVIADALQRYMEMTNDECAAAAGRVKVVQDMACLSCDTPCLMRTVERQKLPSQPTAKGSVGLAPLVAYDLGQIRGTGVMGYYRKDEFPCSPHAWMKGTSQMPLDKCHPRHAGGIHTIHTAEEHMQKVVHSKRNSGWT